MRSFASSRSNDLVIGADGNLSIVDNALAVEVVTRSHMQTRRGEMIYAIQQGIPFDPVVFSGTPNLAQFEAASRARIMEVTGVREIRSFSATMVGDTLSYVAVIVTEFGEVTINV